MQDFTSSELTVLKALFASADGNGHDFGYIEDARPVVKSKASLGGIVASLSKKKVISIYEPITTDSGTYTQFTWEMDVSEVSKLIEKV